MALPASDPTSNRLRVDEGTRTPDRLDHNQELYQLSYVHQGRSNLAPGLVATGRARYPPASSRNDFLNPVRALGGRVSQERTQ